MIPLLALIRRHESGDDYNSISHFVPRKYYPRDHVSTLTIGQILQVQEAWRSRGVKSTAIGSYQFIYKTLRGLYTSAGLTAQSKFGPKAQDKLAMALLERRGLSDWQSGQIDDDAFMLGLAKEWASFPVPYDVNGKRRGQSYYAGDDMNKALVSVEDVQGALDASRTQSPQTGLVALIRAILAFLGRILGAKQ